MQIVKNYNFIYNYVKSTSKKITLIVVTKNQDVEKINLLINQNQNDFGENRVQEALIKWKNIISNDPRIRLHLLGKLQSNKAKEAFEIFHYIHTLDNEKLAQIFSKLESNLSKKIKYFIQVNIGNEPHKNGISVNKLNEFIKYCRIDLNLNIIGLMCIPPVEDEPNQHFSKLAELSRVNNLNELSMGMSNDYECAISYGATFVRVGSKIFSED
jgi:pyridoxal phosphate enzyme (YggS family)